ncbi:MAG: hypothetical protein LBH80_06045 [Prevotellaceae bacterium]|nr:hypothetical protein [Prevotellaceae bacterium]
MKKTTLFLSFALVAVATFALVGYPEKWEKMWENVTELAGKQLPESAANVVDEILREAQRERRFDEIVKASVYKMRFELEKNPDVAPDLLRDFENLMRMCDKAEQKALLHSMIAELYAMYYGSRQYAIERRSQTVGYVPENVDEWSKNLFFDKINGELKRSLNEGDVLQKMTVAPFETLLVKGKNNDEVQPALYDFLAYRAIDILRETKDAATVKNPLNDKRYFAPVGEFVAVEPDAAYEASAENAIVDVYQKLLVRHRNDDRPIALIYADLERLNYVWETSESVERDELFVETLEMMRRQYADDEAVIPVVETLARYYCSAFDGAAEDKKHYRKSAYDMAEEIVGKFPKNTKINGLKNVLAAVTQKEIGVEHESVIAPWSTLVLRITSRNVQNIEVKIYRVDADAVEYQRFRANDRNDGYRPYPNRRQVDAKVLQVPANENFESVTTVFRIPTGAYGIYEFSVMEKGSNVAEEQAHSVFTTTDLAVIRRRDSAKESKMYVLNRKTGLPVGDVTATVLSSEWDGEMYVYKNVDKKNSDGKGLLLLRDSDYRMTNCFFEKGEDKYFNSSSYSYYQNSEEQRETESVTLFTDRSLYRPGQTVRFKGIAFLPLKQEVLKNKQYEVRLTGADRSEVGKKTVTTNEFGSFAGEFVLPTSGLNGAYQLKTSHGGVLHFYVEEYKRPTFEVTVEKPEKEVHFGETVVFNGAVKAYAGYPVMNVQVKYSIVRRSHRLFRWWLSPDKTVATGTAVGDENGRFTVDFVPERTNLKNTFFNEQFYTYTLQVDVTDLKGETQQGVQTVSVGDRSLVIVTTVPEKQDKQTAFSIPVHTETLNGRTVGAMIDYDVYLLDTGGEYLENIDDKSQLKETKRMLSGKYNTDDKNLKIAADKFPSGYYKIVLKTSDAQGKEVKSTSYCILYGESDRRPPVKAYVWMTTPKTVCATGENAEIRFGVSAGNVHLLYEVMRGNTVLESRWITLNNEIKSFKIPFKESYQDGVNVLFTYMKDERFFTRTVQIKKQTPVKTLTPALSVFRDRLQPGEKAEWTVTVPETADGKLLAELMIGMYDASLDAIYQHSWSHFDPGYSPFIPYSRSWNAFLSESKSAYGYFETAEQVGESIESDRLNWFGLFIGRDYAGLPVASTLMRSVRAGNENIVTDMMMESASQYDAPDVADRTMKKNAALDGQQTATTAQKNNAGNAVQLRTNFNETAFFYPQLRTDENGNVQFSFTVPESLTRWNIKMVAHTPDLYFGQAEAQVVTQKEVMVQLNMPRFVRRSDQLTLVATVINLTENALSADVRLELMNPENGQALALNDRQTKTVDLASGETKTVEWQLSAFADVEPVTVKVVATAGDFSDGEQHYLPVLPDKVLLTESMPLVVRAGRERDFTFASLLNQANKVDSKSLTLEFSTNPVWYAVQSLPTLSAPESDNAMDYFAAYYTNGLAGYIADSNPSIKTVFEQWKRGGGRRDALLSNLEQHQELKNILLEETPWVTDAKDESEQKRRIALLFDLNMQANNSRQYLDKMLQLQCPSGGFSWFKGMSESRSITHTILLNMSRYRKMTGDTVSRYEADWIKKALKYADMQIARDFDRLKKQNKDYKTTMTIGDMQWFYLHLRSEYRHLPVNDAAKEAFEYYTAQAERYWTKATLYGKAAAALIAFRNGKTTLANDILKSLKENALKTDESGMYWAKNKAGYFWNERPIGVQTAILEAFAEVTQNTADVDEMKIWLLRQKQTQRWDSPVSTVDAIFALLHDGGDWLSTDSRVDIRLNNQPLEPKTKEAGTGYMKETIAGKDIRSGMANVSISRTGEGIGWGAIYWQYYQDVDLVRQHGGALSVTKKLFVEKSEQNRRVMLPAEEATIGKGDKIVTRLVVTTDRDLEFVVLKDVRAACFEPVDQRSGMVWREGVAYYKTTKDASTQFFFDFLPKGTYVFEYEVWANNAGDFADGMATVQCHYAPEFVGHSAGGRIVIRKQ